MINQTTAEIRQILDQDVKQYQVLFSNTVEDLKDEYRKMNQKLAMM
jgi:hypothetical protein